MPRPRKYQTVAEAQNARRQKDKERKRNQRAVSHALKADPTKRKDAAVNMRNYPVAPVDDESMEMINAVLQVAGSLSWSGGAVRASSRDIEKTCIALIEQWEEEKQMRLPELNQSGDLVLWEYPLSVAGRSYINKYELTFGERWNKFLSTLRVLALFDARSAKNNLKAERHAVKEKAEADASGLTVQQLRGRKDAEAKRKWEKKTQAEYRRKNEERVLQKRQERIERESTEAMLKNENFGIF